MTAKCQRCGALNYDRKTGTGLLLNHRTKFKVKVIELCGACACEALIGLVANRRVPFGYLAAFSKNFDPAKGGKYRWRKKRGSRILNILNRQQGVDPSDDL